MIHKIRLPQWGMGMTEGTIENWLKKVGDAVKEGESLVEIETAKAVEEYESPVSGVIKEIMVEAGETVAVRELIALIEEE